MTDSSHDSDESDTGIYTTLSPVTPPLFSNNDSMSAHTSGVPKASRPPGTLIFMTPPECNSSQNMSLCHRQPNFHLTSVAASVSLHPSSSQSHPTPPNTIDLQSPPPPPEYPSPGQTAIITTPSGGTTGDEQMTPISLCSVSPGPSASGFPMSVDPRQVPLLSHLLQPQPGSVTGEKRVNPMNTQIYLSESIPVPPNLASRPRMNTPTDSPAAPVQPHKTSSFNLPLGYSQQSDTVQPTANGCVLATARPCTGTATSSQHLPPKSPALSRVNSTNQRGICRALPTGQDSSNVEQTYSTQSTKGGHSAAVRCHTNVYESQFSAAVGTEMNSQLPLHSNSTSTGSPQSRRAHVVLPDNSSYSLQSSAQIQHSAAQPPLPASSVSQSRSRSQPNLIKDYVNLDPSNLGSPSLHPSHPFSISSTFYPGVSGLSAWNEMVMRENRALWMQLKQANSYQLELIERRVCQLESVFDQLVDSHERQCQLDCQIVSQYEAELARLALDNDRLRITVNRLNLDTEANLETVMHTNSVQNTPSMDRIVNGRRSLVPHSSNQANNTSAHNLTNAPLSQNSAIHPRLTTAHVPVSNQSNIGQSTTSNIQQSNASIYANTSSNDHWKMDRLSEELKHNIITDRTGNCFVKTHGLLGHNTTDANVFPNMGTLINTPNLIYASDHNSVSTALIQNQSTDRSNNTFLTSPYPQQQSNFCPSTLNTMHNNLQSYQNWAK